MFACSFQWKKHEKLHGELIKLILIKETDSKMFAIVTEGVVFSFPAIAKYIFSCVLLLLLFSHSIVSDSLRPHGLQHSRLPCPSPSPGACSNSCPLSQWCHPIISSSVIHFSCLQSFPALGSFLMNQLFASGGKILCTIACFIAKNISKV